jgi:hypothetical protein
LKITDLNSGRTPEMSFIVRPERGADTFLRQAPLFEIVSVDAKPGESNSSWTRYGWKLTLRNKSSSLLLFDTQVDFVDAQGFPLDHDTEYRIAVRPGESKEVTGEKLIQASIVGRVANVRAKAEIRRD